jgi:hypothetical protein
VFPREEVKRLTLRFLRKSAAELPFEPEIRRGVSKVVLRTVPE